MAAPDFWGRTPLHIAAENDSSEVIQALKRTKTARDETCVMETVVKDGVGIEMSSNTWFCAFRYLLFSTSTVEIDPI